MPDSSIWRGRRVFLTGHTGFKGSWLALWLASMGAEVCGYALDPPGDPNLFDIARIADSIQNIRANINDLRGLQQIISDFAPEVVFHLAAQPLVRRSYSEPVITYETNVMGTVHVLEAVRTSSSVRAVVCVTTDKCYENREWPWGYREADLLGGHDPYSNSKACAELVCAAYRDSFFGPSAMRSPAVLLATARAGNVIGGGDWANDRLVPDLIRGFASGKCVSIRHAGSIRPWQHVLEPLRGYLMLAERLLQGDAAFASAWNFGPNEADAQSVSWIADQLASMWPEPAAWQAEEDDEMHEAASLKLDCSKAHQSLHWHPVLPIIRALQMTIDWTQQWRLGFDMQRVTLEQIGSYQQACGNFAAGGAHELKSKPIDSHAGAVHD